MPHRSHTRRIASGAAVPLLAAASVVAVGSTADAASCTFSPTNSRELRVQMLTNQLVIQNVGDTIVIGEPGKPGFACASRFALDKISVRSANGPGHDIVTLDESRGKFGAISFALLTGTGSDEYIINGSEGDDTYAAVAPTGLSLGANIDLNGVGLIAGDVTSASVGSITINGNGGNDTIVGGPNGDNFSPTSAATRTPLRLNGGFGNDTLVAGRSGRDVLDGGTGSDKVRTFNNLPGDTAFGGLAGTFPGNDFDTVSADTGDSASGFESGGIGGASPHSLKAARGRERSVELEWRHPEAWSKLRSLRLDALRHGRVVGSITLDLESGDVRDAGAIAAVGYGPIRHRGKMVSTTFRIKLAPRMAGKRIDLEIIPKG